jgi:hypothetical protein
LIKINLSQLNPYSKIPQGNKNVDSRAENDINKHKEAVNKQQEQPLGCIFQGGMSLLCFAPFAVGKSDKIV